MDGLGLALTWWYWCQDRPTWKAVIETLLRRTQALCGVDRRVIKSTISLVIVWRLIGAVGGAEEQEYRDKIRKDKAAVYDHYLWRKLLMAGYAKHVDFMMSPEWEARYTAKIERCAH